MQKRLFGTDGIRGVAGEPPLDSATVFFAGRGLGQYLRSQSAARRGGIGPRVVIGEDTRESSRWIRETVAAGLKEAAVETVAAGVVSTPGVAYLTASADFAAGVMISASHNPYCDNGIKVFSSSGYKLPDADELEVERHIFAMLRDGSGVQPYRLVQEPDLALAQGYLDFLRRATPPAKKLSGKLILDCANGSACRIGQEVFSGLGLELKILAGRPDGRNINLDCGALHLENLQRAVLRENAELGVAFDGDADRALFVTARGRIVDGDGILYVASRYLRQRGLLKGNAVVGTVMSNLGLERALESEGLRLLRTPVGDKYVLQQMLRSGANLGGEQSGHVIFSDLATTGDGLLTALQILRIMAETGQPLEDLARGLSVFPQTIRNVRVRQKVPLESLPQVMQQIRASEKSLGNSGRLLVRYSGTERLARVMVEAERAEDVDRHATALARAIEQSVGAE